MTTLGQLGTGMIRLHRTDGCSFLAGIENISIIEPATNLSGPVSAKCRVTIDGIERFIQESPEDVLAKINRED